MNQNCYYKFTEYHFSLYGHAAISVFNLCAMRIPAVSAIIFLINNIWQEQSEPGFIMRPADSKEDVLWILRKQRTF